MSTTNDIPRDILKSTPWVWINLASMILFNATIYSSLRVLGYSGNLSFTVSTIIVAVSALIPTLIHPKPSLAKARFYWTHQYIYPPVAIIMTIVSVSDLNVLGIWLIVGLSIGIVFHPRLIIKFLETLFIVAKYILHKVVYRPLQQIVSESTKPTTPPYTPIQPGKTVPPGQIVTPLFTKQQSPTPRFTTEQMENASKLLAQYQLSDEALRQLIERQLEFKKFRRYEIPRLTGVPEDRIWKLPLSDEHKVSIIAGLGFTEATFQSLDE